MFRFSMGCVGILVFLASIPQADCAVVAADVAANAPYADGWQGMNPDAGETAGSDNGGFGFQTWDFDGGFWDSADSPYPAAHFIDGVDVTASSFNDLGSTAFGLTNGNQKNQGFTSVATRPFVSAMQVGSVFSMDIDNPLLDPVDNGSGSSFSVDFETATGDTRLSLFAFKNFNGDQWTVEDRDGAIPTGMDDTAGSNGFSMSMETTGVETYEMKITPFGGSASTFSGFFKRPGFGDIAAVRITLFGNGSGNGGNSATGEHELFFDNLTIERAIPCDFEPDGDCDIDDVDAMVTAGDLQAGVAVPPADAKFDLNGDSSVDVADYTKWLTDAAGENGHGSPYRAADTDLDRDVDISDFNALASNFDPGGVNAATNGQSKGNSDADNDVDITDFNRLASTFSPGGYDGAAAAVADADPGQVDLVVDLATGEVSLDGNAATISGLQVFSAGNSLLTTDFSAEVLQFVISTNPSTYAEGAFIDTAVNGQVSLGILYDLLVNAQDLTFEYTMIGQPTVRGTVVYIPEPASLVLMGVGGLLLVRRRRAV